MDWKRQVSIDYNWIEKIVIHLGMTQLTNDIKQLSRLLLIVGWLLREVTNVNTYTNLFFSLHNFYQEENKRGKNGRYVEDVYIMLD